MDISESKTNESLSSGSDEDMTSRHANFTPIQTKKRLPQPVCNTALCPSMDLIAFGLGNVKANPKADGESSNDASRSSATRASSTIVVYRTISWQKMFTISQSDLSSAAESIKDENDGDVKDNVESKANAEIGVTFLSWSPDGRILVSALTNGSTLFYDIESCTSAGVPPTPIYGIPSPPLPAAVVANGFNCDSNIPRSSNAPSFASPVVTRSMTAAKRKRLLRMAGKTPSHYDAESASRLDQKEKLQQPLEPMPVALPSNGIKFMHWQRIRKHHSEEWSFRQYYLDRSTFFLPPCDYTMEGNGNGNGNMIDGSMGIENSGNGGFDGKSSHIPRGKTPLSILMTLSDAGLFLYLNGRYRIISHGIGDIPANSKMTDMELVSTSDFRILTSTKYSNAGKDSDGETGGGNTEEAVTWNMSLFSIPIILQHRYNLQFLSFSYGAITSHISTMKTGMEESYGAWSTALRQLDMKFDQLTNLLIKYNVIPQNLNEDEKIAGVRLELLNYILGGHSSRSGDSSNAMDQFFTHPLMNDQLLIRLFRSLEANVAGVESLLRKKVLGPARSLIYDSGELYGLVKAMNAEREYHAHDDEDSGEDDEDDRIGYLDGLPALMDNDTCLRLCEASEILFIVGEQCVSQTVEIRHRLSCMTKWIRATASQVKARGTAMDSVQRDNARKRRVSEQVLRKVADFLSAPLNSALGCLDKMRGSTESILGILLSDYFAKESVFLEKSRSPPQQKGSNIESDGFHNFVETPSLKSAVDVSSAISFELFEEPRKLMTKSVDKFNVIVEEGLHQSNLVSGIHSRYIGKDSLDKEDPFARSTHWVAIANTCNSKRDGCRLVQITAIPVGDFEFENESMALNMAQRPSFYMTTFVQMPKGSEVVKMKFYGDDGNSTLTSEIAPSYKEGRQALGLLLKVPNAEADSRDEELWLFDYDELIFRDIQEPFDRDGTKIVIRKHKPSIDTCKKLTNNENGDDSLCIFSKWRCVRSKTSSNSSSLLMSGSRGIGGITCDRTHTVDLFDLEEDEIDSDEESDNED